MGHSNVAGVSDICVSVSSLSNKGASCLLATSSHIGDLFGGVLLEERVGS